MLILNPALIDKDDNSKEYGPGAVGLIEINYNSLKVNQILTLPFKNPYAFKIKNTHEVWVMCTGAFVDKKSFPLKTIDAGLVKLNIINNNKNMNISKHQALDFAPAEIPSSLVIT